MRKLFLLLFIILLLAIYFLTGCGRKGPLEHLPDEKRPKFNYVVDESNLNLDELRNKAKTH